MTIVHSYMTHAVLHTLLVNAHKHFDIAKRAETGAADDAAAACHVHYITVSTSYFSYALIVVVGLLPHGCTATICH
jgi:hypothetical protein